MRGNGVGIPWRPVARRDRVPDVRNRIPTPFSVGSHPGAVQARRRRLGHSADPPQLVVVDAQLPRRVAGWFDGIEQMKKDPASSNRIIGDALKLDDETVSGMLSGLKLTPFADNAQFFGLAPIAHHHVGRRFRQSVRGAHVSSTEHVDDVGIIGRLRGT